MKTSNGIPLEETSCAVCGSLERNIEACGYDYMYWVSVDSFQAVRCKECGHIYLNPRPRPEAAGQIYPKDYYARVGRHAGEGSRIVAFMKRRIILRRLHTLSEVLRGADVAVLDVGCGDAELCLMLKSMNQSLNVTGLDLAFGEKTQKACSRAGVQLMEGTIETSNLEENFFDVVIMNQLIEHLWLPRKALKKIHSALKPGGFLSIETPNVDGYTRRLFPDATWGGYYFPRHMNLFGAAGIASLLRACGFDIVHQYSLYEVLIWTYGFRAVFCRNPARGNSIAGKFFSDCNPLCLGVFAVIDMIASALGLTTSNQKVICRKPA